MNEQQHNIIIPVILTTVTLVMIVYGSYKLDIPNSTNCQGKANHDDNLEYCKNCLPNQNQKYAEYLGNDCYIINKQAKKKYYEKQENTNQQAKKLASEDQDCYNKGKNYNLTFDLRKDYNLTCEKIKYINDHFILENEQKDAGYVKGSYGGLLSNGHIEGKFYQWIQKENVATGLLTKNMNFHLNCQNKTTKITLNYDFFYDTYYTQEYYTQEIDTKTTDYYTEKDFIMYYTNNCIKE